jgi:hypothetical protein
MYYVYFCGYVVCMGEPWTVELAWNKRIYFIYFFIYSNNIIAATSTVIYLHFYSDKFYHLKQANTVS